MEEGMVASVNVRMMGGRGLNFFHFSAYVLIE